MKTAAWLIIFAFLLTVPLAAAQTCAEYNPPITVDAIPTQTNNQDHITGYHSYNSQATGVCTYTDPSTLSDTYCATNVSVDMAISGNDTGITTSAYHVNHTAQNTGGANNPDGGSSAQGQSAIAFEVCILKSCAFSVSVGPITFPSAAIWSGQQTYTQNCPQEPNPNYAPPPCTAGNGICVLPPPGDSPILVDVTGNGFHLTSAEDGVTFDISGTGHPIKLAWTARNSGNAFLALLHNGKVTNGKELFGNFTAQPPCPDGGRSCLNGYRALAVFDKKENGGNEDGIIDSRDAVFSKLVLWIDANHDGIAQPNELHTLPELGVYSINLKYRDDQNYYDQYGNWFHYQSALNPDPADGTSKDGRMTYDVFFVSATPQKETKKLALRVP